MGLTQTGTGGIKDENITLAKLAHGTSGNDGKFLRANNGADPTWETVAVPKLDAPTITGVTDISGGEALTHTISNWSDDITYVFAPTNCTIGSVNTSGQFTVTAASSGTPSYTAKATTDSLGLDDSTLTTKNFTLKLSAPTISSPADSYTNTNVVYTITSTDTNDDKLILDLGSSNFTYGSVSHGSGSKVGNTIEVTGFTTNNPAVTLQFTAAATYSVKAKAKKIDGSIPDSAYSATDSITIAAPSFTGATGGTITTSGGNTIHTFTSSGTFTVQGGAGANMDYLIIGGGGGGGAGGGGGGGMVKVTNTAVSFAAHSVTVGSGGTGSNGLNDGGDGGNSSFNSTTAIGGGGGAGHSSGDGDGNGRDGGSGGGSKRDGGTGGSGTAGQGNAGGSTSSGAWRGGGGGGGAGGTGSAGGGNGNANAETGGAGGGGNNDSISGSSVCYAGGGGGASEGYGGGRASGGCSGGYGYTNQSGGGCSSGNYATSGENGKGGGGGGVPWTSNCSQNAGAGGSGVVIISYSTP